MSDLPESKKYSLLQEQRIAKLFHGETTPRSGGGGFKKMDVLSEDFGVEAKCRVATSQSYTVQKDILDKADHERIEMRKPFYALAFELGENRGDYFVLNRDAMKAFIETRISIRELIKSIQEEIKAIDERYKQMTSGIDKPSPIETASYTAHKREKETFVEALEKLL